MSSESLLDKLCRRKSQQCQVLYAVFQLSPLGNFNGTQKQKIINITPLIILDYQILPYLFIATNNQ